MNSVTYTSSDTFSTINEISIQVSSYNLTSVFFEAACHANSGAEKNFAGSTIYISRQIFLKFANASANNKVSL